MASLDLLLHHGAILKGRKSWMSCFQLRSVNLGSPGSLFLLAVLSQILIPSVLFLGDFFALLLGQPGSLKVIDVFEPHLLLCDGGEVIDNCQQFLLDGRKLIEFLLAERPDGHGQQVVEICSLTVILFPLLARLHFAQLEVGCKTSEPEFVEPVLLGLHQFEGPLDDGPDELHLIIQDVLLSAKLAEEVGFPPFVALQSLLVELLQDLLDRPVLLDFAAGVEEVHVVELMGSTEFEVLDHIFLGGHPTGEEPEHELDGVILVILFEFLQFGVIVVGRFQFFLEEGLVVVDAFVERYLTDGDCVVLDIEGPCNNEPSPHRVPLHRASEVVPTNLDLRLSPLDAVLEEGDHVSHSMGEDSCTPACANALCAIDEHDREDGEIVVGLDGLVFLLLVVQNVVILLLEEVPGEGIEFGENIPGRSRIFPVFVSGAKLSEREEEVQVVGPWEILRHAHDGAAERHFSVMVSRMFRHVAGQLSHLHLLDQVPFEACKEYLALRRFQSVHEAGDRANVVRD